MNKLKKNNNLYSTFGITTLYSIQDQ
uniref:Uncharacterized protein n=1 Tax=Anguilla anguilla TaxID=7936 RepID=A0A0E9QDD3_ANGAN